MQHTIAFYNIENLFDLFDDPYTNDNDFLPTSDKKWTPKRYENKLSKLGLSIANIGKEESGKHPAIIGVAEVENATVIEDLLNSKHLKEFPYDYAHFDSPDERGIDVALLFDSTIFNVISSETFPIKLYDDDGSIDYTRDILLVTGLLEGETIHVIVNHWPSRREGEEASEHKRITASKKVQDIIGQLKLENDDAKIIVMGDFNDGPNSNSLMQLVNSCDLFNPMKTLRSVSRGSLRHDFHWFLFDQILFSTNFFEIKKGSLQFIDADVFDEDFLKLYSGKYKGEPFRTYVGKKYKGGYSDHFPVFIQLKKV